MKRIGGVVGVCAVVIGCLAGAGLALAALVLPSADPFYTYSVTASAHLSNGTVLKERAVKVGVEGVLATYPAEQVLYKTENELGQPSATVATIIRPNNPPAQTKIISYQTFYDGDAPVCRPSYTLQGGGAAGTGSLESAFILDFVEQGYTVVTSDYEGETDDYGAGQESGRNSLDAVLAAENQLKLPRNTPVGLIGYSGGATATDWAAQEAPQYAPSLNIVGAAAGGIPVDFEHILNYIGGTSDWAGAIPSVFLGLARAYHLDINDYLNAYGKSVIAGVEGGCLNPFADGGLTLNKMLKAPYTTSPVLVRIFNRTIMGTQTPKAPEFMLVGNYDGTGDGVMIAKDVQQLAYSWCKRGVPVEFQEILGADHYAAIAPFELEAIPWFQSRFAGRQAQSNCAETTPGNPLTPLPVPASPARVVAFVRLLSAAVSHGVRGLVLKLQLSSGTAHGVTIELKRGNKVVAKIADLTLTSRQRKLVLRVDGRAPAPGRYTLVAFAGVTTLLHRTLTIPRS